MDINTDAAGLVVRENVNKNNEKYDFTNWVLNILQPSAGMTVLDIGCGTGKQIFPIAEKILPNGCVYGLDISIEALEKLKKKCKDLSYKHIKTFCHDIDGTDIIFDKYRFDVIYSVYAFYYSKNMLTLLEKIKKLLSSSGKIVLFGPGANSNRELIKIINEVSKDHVNYYRDFLSMEEVIPKFKDVHIEKLENVVSFIDINDFINWFGTSELNKVEYQDKVLKVIKNIIRNQEVFRLTKETISISIGQ